MSQGTEGSNPSLSAIGLAGTASGRQTNGSVDSKNPDLPPFPPWVEMVEEMPESARGGRTASLSAMEKYMDPEKFKPREKIDVTNEEFLIEIRKRIVDQLENVYPKWDNKNFLDRFEKGESRPEIDSWAGDAFAWVAKQEYRLNFEEYETLRKILFSD